MGIHNHQVVEISEERGYNPDFYMVTLNTLGYLCVKDVSAISRSIVRTLKPVLVLKVLATGRIPPEQVFKFVLTRIKDTDFIVIGMVFLEEVEENARIIRRLANKEQS